MRRAAKLQQGADVMLVPNRDTTLQRHFHTPGPDSPALHPSGALCFIASAKSPASSLLRIHNGASLARDRFNKLLNCL